MGILGVVVLLCGGEAWAQANAFNPYLQKRLPVTRAVSQENEKLLKHLNAVPTTLQDEVAHRKTWKEEVYPVYWGEAKARNEVLVLLDPAKPQSQALWANVVAAIPKMSAKDAKVVVMGNSSEPFGTDVMGLGVWIAHSRKQEAIPYMTFALQRWNNAKAAQQKQGGVKRFVNEFDAVAHVREQPIHYAYMNAMKPPVAMERQLATVKDAYNAGVVNAFAAEEMRLYYKTGGFPALLVNGKALPVNSSPDAIAQALK